MAELGRRLVGVELHRHAGGRDFYCPKLDDALDEIDALMAEPLPGDYESIIDAGAAMGREAAEHEFRHKRNFQVKLAAAAAWSFLITLLVLA